MEKKTIQISYSSFADPGELEASDRRLVEEAISIARKSYSPYSNFPVGAAVLLDDGRIFAGNNQENAAFPSGTCAERTVLNYVHANFPDNKIKVIAITALNSHSLFPVTPCGFCRQVLVEMEKHQGERIRVILHKIDSTTYSFDSASVLLPLAFEEKDLKQ